MMLVYIALYCLSVAILVFDKKLDEIRERYPNEHLIFVFALISTTLAPIPYFLYHKLMDAYQWVKVGLCVWFMKRKVNKFLKSKGINDRV